MDEQEYIPVEVAREMLGVGPKDMSLLLHVGALRFRTDSNDGLIKWVYAEDIEEAIEQLTRCRQTEDERIRSFSSPKPDGDKVAVTNENEVSFTFLASDVVMLLLAAVAYFDIERDIYFSRFDQRGDISKSLAVVEKIYSRLKREVAAGRPISEIVTEIYHQQPDENNRRVFLYLIGKAQQERKYP
jgi:hypothetical protein